MKKKYDMMDEILSDEHFRKTVENFEKEKGYSEFKKIIKALGKM